MSLWHICVILDAEQLRPFPEFKKRFASKAFNVAVYSARDVLSIHVRTATYREGKKIDVRVENVCKGTLQFLIKDTAEITDTGVQLCILHANT